LPHIADLQSIEKFCQEHYSTEQLHKFDTTT